MTYEHSSLLFILSLHFALSMLLSAGGFLRIYYFVSLGYAFSIATLSVVTPALLWPFVDVFTSLQTGLLFLYGIRLGGFLTLRERNPVYRKELEEVRQRGAHIHGAVKWAIWVGVSLLYVAMYSPALFTLVFRREHGQTGWSLPVGLGIMISGLVIEALADQQKSVFKKHNPKRFCDVGLYRFARCPNYFGEVVFWTGVWFSGLSAYQGLVQYLISGAGYVCIVLVMLGSTRRLELKQDERYGNDPEYQEYVRRIPVLFPFLPIYSFRTLRIYLG